MKLFTVFLALTLASVGLFAQTPAPSTSVLTWTAVTQNTDGTTDAASAVSYNVYASYGTPTGTPSTFAKIATGLTATTFTDSSAALAPGVVASYEVTAVVGGQESALSAAVSKTFPASVPDAPTGLVVK